MQKLVTFLIVVFLFACSESETASERVPAAAKASIKTVAEPQSYGDEGLGIRKETLFEEDGVEPPVATFTMRPPGSGVLLDRAYLDAPPQIPHSTAGLLPITKAGNACTGCHIPAVATAINATAIPASHMRDGNVSHARYNCSQCHVPQAEVTALVDNNF